ncbi:MAG TPA: pyridoxal-dependent decarboxylase [Sphingobacteriaceae bacterium]
MNDLLVNAFSVEDFRKKGHEVIDLLADYLDNVTTNRHDDRVIPWRSPEDQLAFWREDFRREETADPAELFREVLSRSVQIHRKQYLGHQTVPTLPVAVLSAAVSAMLNQGMGVYEMGMVGNVLDKILTEAVASKLGFDGGASGIITSGGSLGNLTALLAARAKATDVWETGSHERARLAVIVSEEAHYCIDRAVRIMGMGEPGIIRIPVTAGYGMRTDLLRSGYEDAVQQGIKVMAVIGCAGTTSTGSYDDLEAIGAFCRENGLWFHVDGAHGAPAAWSPKYAHLVKGIEQADSVVVDFHKMMLTPSLSTAVIFKRGGDAYRTFSQRAQYLWTEQTSEEWYNSGKRTFECTRIMTSLNVYTVFRTYGERIFQQNIDHLYGLGATFARMVRQNPPFELACEPQSNIVCFRYGPDQELNREIRQRLVTDGRYYIVQTILHGQHYLRVSLMNPLTTAEELGGLLRAIRQIAAELQPAR